MITGFQNFTPTSISQDPTVVKARDRDSARKRRAHQKSRRGCDTCRTRHLKCDEGRPKCGQCLHGRRACVFPPSRKDETSTKIAEVSSPSARDQYMLALKDEASSKSCSRGVEPSELLDHFYQTTDHLWLGSTECQEILQTHTPRLALGTPYLLHAMLAYSAYHMDALFPSQQRYVIAATQHYSLALEMYRQAIDDEHEDADALYACCMLLNLLSFKHLSNDLGRGDSPQQQKSLAVDTVGIRFLSGPRIVVQALKPRSAVDQGIWKPLFGHFMTYTVGEEDVLAAFPVASRYMAELEALCRGYDTTNVFDTALASIRLLMRSYLTSKDEMVGLTFCFAIKLDPRFVRLVEEGMLNALLVLCYWYALVSQVEQWWASRTAQVEGMKLLRYLEDTEDIAVRALLGYPAGLLGASSP